MLPLEEVHLERQDGKQLVHVALDVLDAVLFPSPDLGRDIIIHRDAAVRMHVFRYRQVESRVVHQDEHVGVPLDHVALAGLHVAQYRPGMQEHGNEPHVGQVFIVAHHRPALFLHQVAAEKAELRLRVALLQRPLIRCEAWRSPLASPHYQVILHKSSKLLSPSMAW